MIGCENLLYSVVMAPVGIHHGQADWTVEQYLQEAATRSHTAARMVRLLSLPLPGLPTPQLTVTAATAGSGQVSLPIDVRELGGRRDHCQC